MGSAKPNGVSAAILPLQFGNSHGWALQSRAECPLQFCPCNLEFHMAGLCRAQRDCNFYLLLVYALCTHVLPRDITVCLGLQCNNGVFQYHGVCVRHVCLSSNCAHDRALLHCSLHRPVHVPVAPWPRGTATTESCSIFQLKFYIKFRLVILCRFRRGSRWSVYNL